jgi:hypothetical protein
MSFLLSILTAIAQSFFAALLPFLRQQAITPVERDVAEDDPKIEQEVNDAISQYDTTPRSSAD